MVRIRLSRPLCRLRAVFLRAKQACFGLEEEKTSGGSFFDDRRSFVILRVTAAAGISKSYKTSRAQHVKHASKDADGSNPSVPTTMPPSGGFFCEQNK